MPETWHIGHLVDLIMAFIRKHPEVHPFTPAEILTDLLSTRDSASAAFFPLKEDWKEAVLTLQNEDGTSDQPEGCCWFLFRLCQ